MRTRILNPPLLSFLAALPLFYGAAGFETSFFLASAVLSSVFLVEIALSLLKKVTVTKRGDSHLFLLALVLSGIYFTCQRYVWLAGDELVRIFPMTLVSSCLLVRTSIHRESSIRKLALERFIFLAVLVLLGAFQELNAAIHVFGPADGFEIGAFIGLALSQVLLYEISAKRAVSVSWRLGLFYFVLFLLAEGVQILFTLSSAGFLSPLALLLILLFILGQAGTRLPKIKRQLPELPNFYFLSGLWAGFVFLERGGGRGFIFGFLVSSAAAILLPVFSALKERLELFNPKSSALLAARMLAVAGILMLALSSFF